MYFFHLPSSPFLGTIISYWSLCSHVSSYSWTKYIQNSTNAFLTFSVNPILCRNIAKNLWVSLKYALVRFSVSLWRLRNYILEYFSCFEREYKLLFFALYIWKLSVLFTIFLWALLCPVYGIATKEAIIPTLYDTLVWKLTRTEFLRRQNVSNLMRKWNGDWSQPSMNSLFLKAALETACFNNKCNIIIIYNIGF